MTRAILLFPDPRLKKTCAPIGRITPDIEALADDMLAAMYAAPGIGLAAPQIGELLRLVVIDLQKDEQQDPVVLVNPEIVAASKDLATREEGCLSVPGQYAEVTRPAVVKVRYQDLTGAKREIEGDGLMAACLQHEIDHLHGVTMVDHLSAGARIAALRDYEEALSQGARPGDTAAN